MKEYRVLVTEIHQKVIRVKAETEREAQQRANDAYQNMEFSISPEDLKGAEFHVIDTNENYSEKGEMIDKKSS